MAKYLIDSDTLTDIADAIREQTGESGSIQVSQMAQEIENIEGGGSMNYSTTEHEVGTWIDGSTLYERTIVLRSNSQDQYTFSGQSLAIGGSYAVGLTGIENMWLESYSAVRGKSGNTNYTDIGLTEEMVCVWNHSDGSVYVRNQFEPISIVITIRYTKTSA